MIDAQSTVAFAGVAAVLTITPGPDMALVTKNTLAGGRRAGLATTLGIVSGVMLWALASAIGVAALIAASATAFAFLKLAGAAYLIYLGLSALLGTGESDRGTRPRQRSAFVEGLTTNLVNPKIAVFYTTLLPAFIVSDEPALLKALVLAGIHNLLGLVWLSAYVSVLIRAHRAFDQTRLQRALERLTGTVLIALGLRLALERR